MKGRTRRWREQRWLLDAVIRTVGIDWDQPRSVYGSAPGGPALMAEVAAIRGRIRRFTDISREFRRAAERREGIARQMERESRLVTAREHYFMASLLYGMAQWPIFDHTAENSYYNEKKIECYASYAEYADHDVRRAEIPFGDKSLPGWLHIPKNRSAYRAPAVLSIRGMDGHKELSVAMYGDQLLERGIAVLAIDGPGQNEALTRHIHCSATNWFDAGRAILTWLRSQPEIDPDRIVVHGISMGSFWGTQVASADDRLKGCVVQAVCHEPGMHTIFNEASPTYKARYMYMSDYDDEEAFDRFAQTLTLDGLGPKIACPYLVIAGEDDELSPIQYTYELLDSVTAPKQLLIFEGAAHALVGSPSIDLGPNILTFVAEWIRDRLDDQPMETRHMFVDMAGTVHSSSFEEAREHGPHGRSSYPP